ncbi:Tho2 protein [Pseudohyphozyma bogoriensis]|nr:Tho2 protein [Pseudohyphozyma bogoriensis]
MDSLNHPAALLAATAHTDWDAHSDDLTTALVELASSAATSHAPSIPLYSAIRALLFTLADPAPDVARLAAYLSTSLIPALQLASSTSPPGTSKHSDSPKLLADVIIDVMWQIDQELDSGVLKYLQPAAPTAVASVEGDVKMEVEGAEGTKSEDVKMDVDPVAVEAAMKQQVDKTRARLGELARKLIDAGVLPAQDCLERFETAFLTMPSLGLIMQSSLGFSRLEVRARTALFYKQQKFNLLREETEGYSKLVVEVTSNMGPAHSSATGKSQESEKQRFHRANAVQDSVKSLIGTFDLDPDRTLDLILDVFSDQVIQHHQFFIDFLSVSPWAPKEKKSPAAATDIDGGAAAAETKGKEKLRDVNVGLEADDGSSLIAQILGFKFAYYQTTTTEDVPENLYLMTALLIWHGFVKLADLWTHLSPDDEDLAKLDGQYRDEQAQLARNVGGGNALAMAGALADDDAPAASPSSSAAAAKAAAAEAAAKAKRALPNQKLGLLRALLSIGDLPHSLFILSQYPVLTSANLDVADLLLRLLAQCIQPAYDTISISKANAQYAAEFVAPKAKFTAASTSASAPKASKPASVAYQLTGKALPNPTKSEVFFFAEWKSRLPKAGDWDEVLVVLELLLPFISVFTSRDFPLYSKLCRIICADVEKNTAAPTPRLERWHGIVRTYLIPSLSLLDAHSPAALTIWTVLERFPVEKRWQLYGEWKDSFYRRIPALEVRKAEAERDVKGILRRLSTDNAKKLGKSFAKAAHTNPTIVFAIALNQVQSYDNLILPVVEACRYLTNFGFDVLAYSLLDALTANKAKTKDDGTSVALWLQGLATFTGHIYRRWGHMRQSIKMVLQYLVNQLVAGNAKDLVVLREMVSRMTGIEPFADLSDPQVLSLAGGPHLRGQVFNQTVLSQVNNRLAQTSIQNAKDRLAASLKESSLHVPLLVSIAIQRQASIANTEAHLKSLGGLFDQACISIHAVLFQYNELLQAIMTPEELGKLVPPVTDLLENFGIEPAVAFDISRPKLRSAIKEYDEKLPKLDPKAKRDALSAKLALEKALTESGASPAPDVKVKVEEPSSAAATPPPASLDVVMGDAAAVASPALSPAPTSSTSVWHPALVDVIQETDAWLPEEVRSVLGAPFFVTFWQLTLYDLYFPKERYDAETTRLQTIQREVNTNINKTVTATASEKERFGKQLIGLATSLGEEAITHMTAQKVVSRRLQKEKNSWFPVTTSKEENEALITQFIQYCVLPRAKLSLPDAVYTFQMINRIHSIGTPYFHTALLYDKLLTQEVGPFLFSCSENEARNFARFLFDILSQLHAWIKDSELYKKQAIAPDTCGFHRQGPKPLPIAEGDYLIHEKIYWMWRKWQNSMMSGFRLGFDSGEYMCIKNSILVLTKIAPSFPTIFATGQKLLDSVNALIAKETREDLKILAQGYKAVLEKRKKHWVEKPETSEEVKPSEPASKPTTAAAPQPPSTSTSSTPAQSPAATPAPTVPTGPRHTLPVRPGAAPAQR